MLQHVVEDQLDLWGSPRLFWCYCDENFIGVIKNIAGRSSCQRGRVRRGTIKDKFTGVKAKAAGKESQSRESESNQRAKSDDNYEFYYDSPWTMVDLIRLETNVDLLQALSEPAAWENIKGTRKSRSQRKPMQRK